MYESKGGHSSENKMVGVGFNLCYTLQENRNFRKRSASSRCSSIPELIIMLLVNDGAKVMTDFTVTGKKLPIFFSTYCYLICFRRKTGRCFIIKGLFEG